MYVCEFCVDKYHLEVDRAIHATGSCEICGELYDNWSYNFVVWTKQLVRFVPVKEQLKSLEEKCQTVHR